MYRWAWRFYLLLAVAGLFWIGVRDGRIHLQVFLRPDHILVDVGAGLAVGAGLIGLWEFARRSLKAARVLEEKLAEVLGSFATSEARAVAFLSALGEEVFFRGAVQGSWGFIPAAVLFTLLHVGPGPEYRIWTAYSGIAGLALGALTVWSGTLLPAIVAHFAVNLVGLNRLVRRSQEPTDPAAPADAQSDGSSGSAC